MTFVLPLPPTGNHYKRLVRVRGRVRFFRTRATEDFLEAVRRAAQGRQLKGAVAVVVRVFRKHKRGDIDGWLKVTLDSLQGVAYRNDSQIRSLAVTMSEDPTRPRLEVDVAPYFPRMEIDERTRQWIEASPGEEERPKLSLVQRATPNYRPPKGSP